jgi:hypothetical protein
VSNLSPFIYYQILFYISHIHLPNEEDRFPTYDRLVGGSASITYKQTVRKKLGITLDAVSALPWKFYVFVQNDRTEPKDRYSVLANKLQDAKRLLTLL